MKIGLTWEGAPERTASLQQNNKNRHPKALLADKLQNRHLVAAEVNYTLCSCQLLVACDFGLGVRASGPWATALPVFWGVVPSLLLSFYFSVVEQTSD